MLLGRALLVAPVVEPGATVRAVYLPSGARWFDWWTGEAFDGGQTVTRSAPFDRPPLFAREGSVVALNTAEQRFAARADRRGFVLFPIVQGSFEAEIFDDDGESEAWREGRYRLWRVRATCTPETIEMAITATENGLPIECDVKIVLPVTETRRVTVSGGSRR